MTDQAKKNKNADKLASFVAYCEAHPEERFWQALRNWSEFSFILGSSLPPIRFMDIQNNGGTLHDTFYDE